MGEFPCVSFYEILENLGLVDTDYRLFPTSLYEKEPDFSDSFLSMTRFD